MFLLSKISSNLKGVLIIVFEPGTLAVHILAALILITCLFLHSSPFSAHPRLFSALYRSLSFCSSCCSCLAACEDITTLLWRQREKERLKGWEDKKSLWGLVTYKWVSECAVRRGSDVCAAGPISIVSLQVTALLHCKGPFFKSFRCQNFYTKIK